MNSTAVTTGNIELNSSLGDVVTSLWLELQRAYTNAVSQGDEGKTNFVTGKISGLRIALPLLRGAHFSLRVIDSRLLFVPGYPEVEVKEHADVLRNVLQRDFQALNEGGKLGMKKEWLEGHIQAIGYSLALIQPFIGKQSLADQEFRSEVHSLLPASN